MATNANFNLSKSAKLISASILDRVERRTYIKAMINAESSFIAGKNRKFSDPAVAARTPNKPQGNG